ncbi:hypothetical protein, partial [Burkholderia cepacia]|uniref:hypothetical protein n=1 Tax=Burkholderia cepacia TaxID=292 RepID=UPI001ABA3DF1
TCCAPSSGIYPVTLGSMLPIRHEPFPLESRLSQKILILLRRRGAVILAVLSPRNESTRRSLSIAKAANKMRKLVRKLSNIERTTK